MFALEGLIVLLERKAHGSKKTILHYFVYLGGKQVILTIDYGMSGRRVCDCGGHCTAML